jgi:hypothetical protein
VAFADPTNPSAYHQSITFTATVTPTSGSGPTGHVTFMDGTTTLVTVNLTDGTALLPISTLALGSHSITAVYSGDANFSGNTSATDTHIVKPAATTTLSDSKNPSVFGQTTKLKATVVAASKGSGTPTGSVTFELGGVALPGNSTVTLSKGKASFSISTLAVGNNAITAVYNGDNNFAMSTSTVDKHTVTKAATKTTLSVSSGTTTFGTSITISATVTASSPGAGTPTGTVTFTDNGTIIPGQGAVQLTAGTASFQTTTLPVGSDKIVAIYNGDGNFNGSKSSSKTHKVKAAPAIRSAALAAAVSAPTAVSGAKATIPGMLPPVVAASVTAQVLASDQDAARQALFAGADNWYLPSKSRHSKLRWGRAVSESRIIRAMRR